MSITGLKKKVYEILKRDDFPSRFRDLAEELPLSKILKPLLSGICHTDEQLHWHAVSCVGEVVKQMAESEMESARVVMRRFMWSLNDESGGIGWGVPEAMAECLARHHALAEEYAHILVSFMREDGFFLEYEPLQAGLMWGVGRLAEVEPDLLRQKRADAFLLPYLDSPLPSVRGLAALAIGRLAPGGFPDKITRLLDDQRRFNYYQDRQIISTSVADLARQAAAPPF